MSIRIAALASALAVIIAAAKVFAAPQGQPASPAPAPPQPIIVDVDPTAASITPPDAVRAAVSRELQSPAVAPASPDATNARGTLSIAVGNDGTLVLTYRDALGHQVLRAIAIPNEQHSAIDTVAIIAGNLARNDADDLLRQMAPPPPPASPPAPIGAPAAPTPEQPVPNVNRARLHPVTLGLEAFGSTVPASAHGGLDFVLVGGAHLSYAPSEHFALGLMDIGASSSTNEGLIINGSPFAEVFTFLQPWLQLYGQAGVAIQSRAVPLNGPSVGLAPFAAGGVRVWIGNRVSVGLGARGMGLATNFAVEPQITLPSGTFLLMGGLDLAVHF